MIILFLIINVMCFILKKNSDNGCDFYLVNVDDSICNCLSFFVRVRDYLWNVLILLGVKIKYELYSCFLLN